MLVLVSVGRMAALNFNDEPTFIRPNEKKRNEKRFLCKHTYAYGVAEIINKIANGKVVCAVIFQAEIHKEFPIKF